MHTKYTTLGFVLEKVPHGEASSYFSIFTREFGKVFASAQAVREVKSKLRMNLEELSFVEVSLVRGKSVWKITGAKNISSLFGAFRDSSEKLEITAQCSALLLRLLHGEEKNDPLFQLLFDAFSYFKSENLTSEEMKNFEILLVLNILHELGYVGNKNEFSEFVGAPSWGSVALSRVALIKKRALSEINRSLLESQL
ncbi:MAG: DNA repair protein RecO [Candidatus Taylorbacteria bacterium]